MIPRLIACVLIALALPAAARDARVLAFASYAPERPSEELTKLEPFQQYLEQVLRQGGQARRVELRIYPTYDAAVAAVVGGQADFARMGPASYVLAKRRNPRLRLLAIESEDGVNQLTGYIHVAESSPIRTLADLKGKRIAFGEPNSTTGRYFPQAALVKAGIRARDLAAFDYLGRHDKVVYGVAAGLYDAGCSNDRSFRKYGQEKGLRAIHAYQSPSHAWVAHPGLGEALSARLTRALLKMRGPALANLARDGFLPARDADYDPVRAAMREAEAFTE